MTLAKQGELLYEVKLKNQKGKSTLLLNAEKTIKGIVLDTDMEEHGSKLNEIIQKEVLVEEPVKAPVKKGDVVGKMVYKYQGNIMGEVNLIAETDVKRGLFRTVASGIKWFFNLKAVKITLILIISLIAAFYALVINNAKKNKSKRRKKRR